jgi:hypothetical protein
MMQRQKRAVTTGVDFSGVFDSLREIMKKYQQRLVVHADQPDYYALESTVCDKKGRPVCFGAVRICKTYVSYYLMPVYMFPDLLQGISGDLKERMQGKSCFNFKQPDWALFRELAELTKGSFQRLKKEGLVE